MPGSTLGVLIALELHSVSEPPFPPAEAAVPAALSPVSLLLMDHMTGRHFSQALSPGRFCSCPDSASLFLPSGSLHTQTLPPPCPFPLVIHLPDFCLHVTLLLKCHPFCEACHRLSPPPRLSSSLLLSTPPSLPEQQGSPQGKGGS